MGWYQLAADLGDAKAQFALGLMYMHGAGAPQDYGEAVRWDRCVQSREGVMWQIR